MILKMKLHKIIDSPSDNASQFQHPLYQFAVFINLLILITQTTATHMDETTGLAFTQPALAY